MLNWYLLVSCMVHNTMYSYIGLNFNGLWISMKSNKIWAQFVWNTMLFIMSLNHHVVWQILIFLLQLWCHDCMLKLCFLQLLIRNSSRCSVIWKIQEISLNLKWNLVLNPVLFYNIEDLWSFEVLSIYL